jgi:hypothetical protein
MKKTFHDRNDNVRHCAVCKMELQTTIDKIAPKKRGNLNANIRVSEDGVYFKLVNAWFCNDCWRSVNRGLTDEEKELYEKEKERVRQDKTTNQRKKEKQLDYRDRELFEKIKELRNNLAKERNLPAYCILKDDSLHQLVLNKPQNLNEILKIKGFGERKASQFGELFLNKIKQNDDESSVKEKTDYSQRLEKIKQEHPNAYTPWEKSDEEILLKLFNEGKSTKEISKILERQTGGIRSRLKKLGAID